MTYQQPIRHCKRPPILKLCHQQLFYKLSSCRQLCSKWPPVVDWPIPHCSQAFFKAALPQLLGTPSPHNSQSCSQLNNRYKNLPVVQHNNLCRICFPITLGWNSFDDLLDFPFIFCMQIQLQSALLQSMNASSGVVQSLASQNNLPASLISSALINANVAANLNGNSSATNSMCTHCLSFLYDNAINFVSWKWFESWTACHLKFVGRYK